MLSPYSLPRTDGFPVGRYRLLFGAHSEAYAGVRYVDGRSVDPVDGRTILRQAQAFGPAISVEPWDEETAERCIAFGRANDRPDVVEAVEAWLAARATPAEGEGEGDDSGDVDPGRKDGGADSDPPPPMTDELDAFERDELVELATALGLTPGNKQAPRLRKEIRVARLAAVTPAEGEGEG